MQKNNTTGTETMTVSIPSKEEHAGYDGNIMTGKISKYCPVCGGERGEPHKVISYDGSRRLHVDGWENPCGHIDKYSAVRNEMIALANPAPTTPSIEDKQQPIRKTPDETTLIQIKKGDRVMDENGRKGYLMDIILAPNAANDKSIVAILYVRLDTGNMVSATSNRFTPIHNELYEEFYPSVHFNKL